MAPVASGVVTKTLRSLTMEGGWHMSTLVVNLSAVVKCSSMAPSNVDPSIPLTHVVYLRLTIWGEAWIVWSWNVVQGCGIRSLGKLVIQNLIFKTLVAGVWVCIRLVCCILWDVHVWPPHGEGDPSTSGGCGWVLKFPVFDKDYYSLGVNHHTSLLYLG